MKLFLAILLLVLVPGVAHSQTSKFLEVQGLGVDPFLIEINSTAGSVEQRSITLTNTTDAPLSFIASINDFTPNGTTGQALFLDSDEESDPQYSLSQWLTITKQPNFTIPPHGNTVVEFSIAPPLDAEPGTHYGGILFGQAAGAPVNSEVSVEQKVGAIIIVKLGRSQESVHIESLKTDKGVYYNGPVNFQIELVNDGNVHSKAKGDISIRNIFGRTVKQVPVNRDAQIILPETTRDFTSSWSPKLAFGRYTAEAVLYYGSPKLELHQEVTFWVLPVKEAVIGVMLLLILCIIIYISIKRYNRYIINKSR